MNSRLLEKVQQLINNEKIVNEEIRHFEKMNEVADNRYKNLYRINYFAEEKKVSERARAYFKRSVSSYSWVERDLRELRPSRTLRSDLAHHPCRIRSRASTSRIKSHASSPAHRIARINVPHRIPRF